MTTFYVAIFLILLGLLLLSYILIAAIGKPLPEKEGVSYHVPAPNPAAISTDQPLSIYQYATISPAKDAAPPHPVQRSAAPPPAPAAPPVPQAEEVQTRHTEVEVAPKKSYPTALPLSQVDHEAIALSIERMRNREREVGRRSRPSASASGEKVTVTGVLFIDHERKILAHAGHCHHANARDFLAMKRIGNGSLQIEGSKFQILSDTLQCNYKAADLEQILFFKDGIALVPLFKHESVPLLLTKETDKIRSYIQKYSDL